MTDIKTGSCLCGAIRYELRGPLRAVIACHCEQCRKSSGHYVAATRSLERDMTVTGDTLVWYRGPKAHAERGFCRVCGSSLFWRRMNSGYVTIHAGAIDAPTGLKLEGQIYPEEAGDYYDLPDVPVFDQRDLVPPKEPV